MAGRGTSRRQPRGRFRFGRFTSLALLVLLGVAAAIWLLLPPPTADIPGLPTGSLRVDDAAAGTYGIAGHTVVVSEEGLSLVAEDTAVPVWASPAGRSFVLAARGQADVEERIGMFRVRDRWEQMLDTQNIQRVEETGGRLVLSGSLADAEGAAVTYRMAITASGPVEGATGPTLEVVVDNVDRVTLLAGRDPEEAVYGLGEQFTGPDLSGGVYPILTREQGIGRGHQPLSLLVDLAAGAAGAADTTYAPLPFYVTGAPRSLWLTDPGISVVDLRDEAAIGVTVWGDRLVATTGRGAAVADHVSAHARATGLMRPPPQWTDEGLIAGLQGGTEEVRAEVAALQGAGVDLAAVWLQDWVGQRSTSFGDRLWWNWTLDTERYPGWDQLVADLAAQDIRTLTYVNPFLSPDAGERAGRDLYAEAAAAGYLLTTPDGEPYLTDQNDFDAALVDVFDPAAREWLTQVLVEEVLGVGATGFMADFGEAMPFDAVSAVGTGAELHNEYPVVWAQITRDALDRAGLDTEGLVWHRSAGPGSAAAATMFWAGDQNVDFSQQDGLPSALDGLLNGGLSGMTLNHFDIGGYTSIVLPGPLPDVTRSVELHHRSAELAAFTPLMRTHEGNRPELGAAATDPEVAALLARMVELYQALGPERRRLSADVAERGLPLVRHPVLEVPEQLAVVAQPDVFFLGPDLFVAPVVTPGQDQREVTLPAGVWQDLWTGQQLQVPSGAGPVTAEAPIGRPPAWVRAGSPVAEDVAAWRQ